MDTILETIPHRPPFLFIDEVVDIRDNGATAKRLIRGDEPQFKGHYPGNPIMPGVLLSEAVFQTAAYYMVHKLAGEGVDAKSKTPVLSRILDAKFKQMVKPGDTIAIDVVHEKSIGIFQFFRGKITCKDKTVMVIECALALIDEKKGEG